MDLGAPVSYLVLETGVPVYDSSGTEVGSVEHVLAAEEEDIFDGLVIDAQLGPGGKRFVDATQVDELYENAVVLTVPAADADKLPEPSANPAVQEHHGIEDSEGKLEGKLKRAWELVSGKRPE